MQNFLQIILIFLIWIIKFCIIKSLPAEILCNRIPGLSTIQRQLCTESSDALVALGAGTLMGARECQHQFKGHRWNCSNVWQNDVFGQVMFVGSREAAFTYAITSAGAVHYITAACARGNISLCGCDAVQRNHFTYHQQQTSARNQHHQKDGIITNHKYPWKWGGCSADISFGLKFARKFLDAREIEKDARSLMNLHNNRAGRKIVKNLLRTECKCHGVSGSCAMKTCWKSLPPFRVIGDMLMKKYNRAKFVQAVIDNKKSKSSSSPSGYQLVINRKMRNPNNNNKIKLLAKRMELVYIEASPNYCERNLMVGALGTVGRSCNRSTIGIEGCDLLCCGRGYNTHQINKTWQCNCRFKWCCQVQCDICNQRYEEYTCK